jgi:RimJ/RimL family protein N-acetyltransferase
MTLTESRVEIRNPGPDESARFLAGDRVWSAYGLGFLEQRSTDVETWSWGAPGNILSLLMRVRLGQLTTVFLTGDCHGLATIAAETSAVPASGVFSTTVEALEALQPSIRVSTAYPMTRMRLRRAELRPRHDTVVTRLTAADLEAVRSVYGMWTDSHQLPGQLDRGVYFGVFRNPRARDRELISVAGTHAMAPRHGVAAIGNVLTHRAYRNRGLASVTTTAVAEELFRLGCEEVVLNVREGNDAARAVYYKLGFTDYLGFVEGIFHRL